MIDNFSLIEPLLQFETKDDFYHSVILQRKKENPQIGSNSHIIKTYYIRSIDDLGFYKDEMISLANFHNARVCINLNRRSFEKVAFQTLRKITDIIMNKDYKSVRKAYNSVCGTYSADKDKKWIIDVDIEDENKSLERKIISYINTLQPEGDKYIITLPTKNGKHLITKPFNKQDFKKMFDIDIHCDNPTLLMIP